MEFKEVVKTRRSCRAFETSAVPDDQLAAIMEAGQWAPSPMNFQPWEYIIITNAGVKAEIKKIAEEAKQTVIDSDGPGWVNKYGLDFLEDAPILIVVVFDPSKKGLGDFFNQEYGAVQAVSACVQNMMLAAAEYGLGTLWFTFFDPAKLHPVLNIPDNLEIAGVIPVGKPKEPVKAPPRKEPKVHRERFTSSD
jgi:5,6-dimethylbenzimidazole synthase